MKREKKYKIKEDKSRLEYELVIGRETDNNRKIKKKKIEETFSGELYSKFFLYFE